MQENFFVPRKILQALINRIGFISDLRNRGFNVRSSILHTLITACAQRYSQREFWHKDRAESEESANAA
jgi:hypothetical protein